MLLQMGNGYHRYGLHLMYVVNLELLDHRWLLLNVYTKLQM